MPIDPNCFQVIHYSTKTPFSFFQNDITEVYDVCSKVSVSIKSVPDLNHWFGSMVLIGLCIVLAYYLYKIEKRGKMPCRKHYFIKGKGKCPDCGWTNE
jgi:hypothetical protein